MYLVLPKDTTRSAGDFARTLDADAITNALSHLNPIKFDVSLPKWSYDYTLPNLQSELAHMGMGIAFSKKADFSAIYPGRQTALSQVIHKACINVSEQGTEAAAATGVIHIMGCKDCNVPPQPLNLNHPFVYFIREKQTELILFMGIVNDPSQH
jgi:serpin B